MHPYVVARLSRLAVNSATTYTLTHHVPTAVCTALVGECISIGADVRKYVRSFNEFTIILLFFPWFLPVYWDLFESTICKKKFAYESTCILLYCVLFFGLSKVEWFHL